MERVQEIPDLHYYELFPVQVSLILTCLFSFYHVIL